MTSLLDRFRSGDDTEGTSLGKHLLLIAAGLLGLWLLLQFVPAASPPPVVSDDAGTVAVQPEPSDGAYSLFTPGRIAVIVLLLAGGGWAVYLNRQRSAGATANAPMHSLGRLSLSQNQHLQLVHCNDEVLLLGVSPEAVTLLKSYPRADFAAAPDEEHASLAASHGDTAAAPLPPEPSGFADVLRQYAQFNAHE